MNPQQSISLAIDLSLLSHLGFVTNKTYCTAVYSNCLHLYPAVKSEFEQLLFKLTHSVFIELYYIVARFIILLLLW
jgi:hypothetical protein